MCAHPVSPGNTLASSKTANYYWQLMRIKSKLQKALHASTRNRQLTIPHMLAKRLEPMEVCACNNPSRWGCPGTMQGIVMGAVQRQTQGLHNCTNLYHRDNTTIQACIARGLYSGVASKQLWSQNSSCPPRPTEKHHQGCQARLFGKVTQQDSQLACSKIQESSATKKPVEVTPQLLQQHSTSCNILDPTDVPEVSVIEGLKSSPRSVCCATSLVHAPQFTDVMQRWYQDAS